MRAVSTSFLSGAGLPVPEFLAALERLDIDAVELEYRLTAPVFGELTRLLRRSRLRVSSLHNFCPLPTERPPGRASGDLFPLSSPDPDIRRESVKWTTRTLEHAADLEAGVVVLHCGLVEMDGHRRELYAFDEKKALDSPACRKMMAAIEVEREAKRKPYVEALLRNLDRLIREAERLGVVMGLENRFYVHELPGLEEFDRIFRTLDGAPLGYWHDTGHAHALECLGIMPRGTLLDRFGDRLVGIHFHDAVGLEDHRPPGDGEIDLAGFVARRKDRITEEFPVVMELRPGTSEADMVRGLAVMKTMVG